MSTVRYLSHAAKAVDARSARSRQRKVGASEIGVCRRRAGYSHHGHPVTDPENVTGLKAVAGTWFHKGALLAMRSEWGALIETTVEDEILRGHVDAIELPNDWREAMGQEPDPNAPECVVVDDLKTRDDARAIDIVRVRGPKRSELYQTHLYGSLLRRGKIGPLDPAKRAKKTEVALRRIIENSDGGGLPVEIVRLRYMPRTGHEDAEYVHEQPFDEDIEREAWEWVEEVTRSESPDVLPRDQDGPGLSIVCDNCPFVTACWGTAIDGVKPQAQLIVTDRDLAETLAEYDRARAVEREAKERKDAARAKLDATAPAIYTDGKDVTYKVTWSGGREVPASTEPDVDAMLALFEKAGLTVPVKEVPARTTAKSIGVVPWERVDPPCGKPVGEPVPYRLHGGGGEWLQDRPRGGWTLRGDDGAELESATAGQFAKANPAYVDPRPPCILKPKHSGDCADESLIRELEVDDDPFAENADLTA